MRKKLTRLGSETAKIGFYLPNPPNLPADWDGASKVNIEELITLNGNHWRKIFVIMAKIVCPNNDWRDYLPLLLQQNESIHFGQSTLCPNAKIHLVCGQQSALALSLDILTEPQSFRVINQSNQQIYLLPYLDYRQCPNHTIASLRTALAAYKKGA
ncbi:hypothetical protein K0I73_11855 [Shewanella mesophila]|uniref:DUF6942 family protein n=1 Tax=Shewanella mesophila TaxID=2864208 RepID=UPI001C6564B9|nr:hypothetical protein [Shewanella mesophila]QYJ84944.1 hypothetical protein K0I73_11855 [Shewanella mesophila]